jgi:hypothetical protein
MPYEERDGDGSLFNNSKKEPGDRKPDMDGYFTLGGKRYRIAAWRKQGRSGEFLSLRVEEDKGRDQRDAPRQASKPTPRDDADFDAIPF